MVLLILGKKTGIGKCRQIQGQRSEIWIWAQRPESLKRHTEFKAGQSLDQLLWTKMMKCVPLVKVQTEIKSGKYSGSGAGVGDLFMGRLEFRGKKLECLE